MSGIERRMLLGAAGVVGVAALMGKAKAGPIAPPVGPVGSTGRTLDEIYNRIPGVGGADGRVPISGGTTGLVISQPGSYVLTGNITVSGAAAALAVNGSGVTVDLNGFRLTQTTATGGSPISIGVGVSGVVVRNGSVSGGNFGVGFGINCVGVILEDIAVQNAKTTGIILAGGCRGCVIRRCGINDTGSTTIATDASQQILGINNFTAIGTRIEDCVISRIFYNGVGAPVMRGISMSGSGNVVTGCQIFHDAAVTGTGIVATGTVYRNNAVSNFSIGYSGGTDGGGNF